MKKQSKARNFESYFEREKNDEIMKASLRLFESVASHMGKVCISLCK